MKIKNVMCERIIDAGKGYYKGRIMVVLFKHDNEYYHWVTNSNTKELQNFKPGKIYDLNWTQVGNSVSRVNIDK